MIKVSHKQIHGRAIDRIIGFGRIVMSDDSLAYSAVTLVFGDQFLELRADPDSDEIIFDASICSSFDAWNDIPEFGSLIGKELGWWWIARNSNGYEDMLIISFDGNRPQIGFLAEASRISVFGVDI